MRPFSTKMAPGRMPSGVTILREVKAREIIEELTAPPDSHPGYKLSHLALQHEMIILDTVYSLFDVRICGREAEIGYNRRSSNMNNPFMARAIQLSIENVRSGRGGPFGAVVVREGKIIAEGANSVTARNDPTAHAEILAIRGACAKLQGFELRGCELYSSCEPCPMCLGAIYWARPDRVYYANTAEDAAKIGFDDSLIYQEIPRPHSERKIPMVQMMRHAALEAFSAWAELPNKSPY
jgi:guanine deaminase